MKQIFFETNIFLKQVLESKTQTLDTTGDITIGNFTEKLKSKFLWKIYNRKLLLVYFYFLILLKLNKTDGSQLNTVIKQLFYSFLNLKVVVGIFFGVLLLFWSYLQVEPHWPKPQNEFLRIRFKKKQKNPINIYLQHYSKTQKTVIPP